MLRLLMSSVLGALVIAVPAAAGTRATFVGGDEGKALVVEVGDNGDARVSGGDEGQYGLMLGGHFYIVDAAGGAAKVARIEDVANAIDQVMPPVFKGMLSGAPSKPFKALRTVKTGTRTIAGRQGTVYAIYGLNDDRPTEATEYVISADPALKPVGAAMEQFMNAAIVPAAPLIGTGATEIIAQTRAIFALGTPLDAGRFRLAAIEPAVITADRLKLPATPVTVTQLVQEMKRAQGLRK